MKRAILTVLISCSIATPALAENSKTYLIGEFGSSTYANMYPFPNPNKIGLGVGFYIDKYLAAELVYTIFGESTVTGPGGPINLKASSLVPALVGYLPVSQQFNLYGKLGLALNRAKTNIAVTNFSNSSSVSNNAIYFGFGAQYSINSQVGLRFQYERFGKFENKSPAMTPTALSAGIIFNL